MSIRIALAAIAAVVGLATAPAAAAENQLSDPATIPWTVVTNSFSS